MHELTEAISSELSNLFGVDNVYFGFARDTMSNYVQFSQLPSGPSEYCTDQTGTQNNAGVRTTFPFLFMAFSDLDTTARDNIKRIIDRFEKYNVVLATDKLLKVETLSQSVTEDPEQTDDAKTKWVGSAVIEFSISKGV